MHVANDEYEERHCSGGGGGGRGRERREKERKGRESAGKAIFFRGVWEASGATSEVEMVGQSIGC